MTTTFANPLAVRHLDAIRAARGEASVNAATADTLEALSSDDVNKRRLIPWLRDGVAVEESRVEIRTALRAIARAIQPRSNLEIGTRRCWSLAQVLAESPAVHAYAFDWWVEAYGSVENPGPDLCSTRANANRAI